jgi:[acyl-carrier-protein] S-malonyltransferase
MLDELSLFERFRSRYETVCDALGYDLLAEVRAGTASVHANLTGSLMTVLASAVSLDLLRDDDAISSPVAGVAGYSVGQWVALYAAGAISFEQLVGIVQNRAVFMDQCAAANPGRMIAVIGIAETPLELCCSRIRDRGLFVAIANYNAAGQYTLSMESRAVATVMEEIQALKPIKWIELQAAGPWHSQLMMPAREALAGVLEHEVFRSTTIPAIDNVTGDFFPADVGSCRQRLADQVCQPVRWSRGVETLVARGATRCIEVGYGNMLTKFGFFINRNVQHLQFRSSLV